MSPAVTLHLEQWQQRANTAQTHRPRLVRAPTTVYRLSCLNVTFPHHHCLTSSSSACLPIECSQSLSGLRGQWCHLQTSSNPLSPSQSWQQPHCHGPTFSLSSSSRGQGDGNNCGIQYLCFNKKQINSEIHSKYLPTKYEGETIPLICLV